MIQKNLLNKIIGTTRRFIWNLVDNPATILLYHRVVTKDLDPQQLAVSPDNFFSHIEFLKKYYNLISIDELEYLINSKIKIPPKCVCITFDDGYADNLLNAIPILESFSVQAIFYVCTSLIDSDAEFWWDELERIFLTEKKLPTLIEIELNGEKKKIDTSNTMGKNELYRLLQNSLIYMKPGERDRIINKLKDVSCIEPYGRKANRVLTTPQVKQLSNSKSAVVGAHTHTHCALSIFDHDGQYQEIKKSKEVLEKITNKPIRYFSYPYGSKKDYNEISIQICKELGFSFACSNTNHNYHLGENRFEISRMIVRDWGVDKFSHEIKKFRLMR